MENTLVSIIVPTYNRVRLVGECIDSVLRQEYSPIQLVVHDNGSTDGSVELIKKYDGTENVELIFTPKPIGESKAFNIALERCRGGYIGFVDSDDVIEKWHVSNLMVKALADPDADFVYGNFKTITSGGKTRQIINVKGKLEKIFDECGVGLCAALVKKSVYDELGGWWEELRCSEDWAFLIAMKKAGKRGAFAGDTGYCWRQHGAQKSQAYKRSGVRKEDHGEIRRRFKLRGPCRCGCQAPGYDG